MPNPLGIAYDSTVDGFLSFAKPTAVIVVNANADAPEVQDARRAGARVYRYRRPISILNTVGPLDVEWYMGDPSKVPLWGNGRTNNTYSKMTDLRVGSVWVDYMIDSLERLILSDRFDGVFLDVLGCRPWGTNWTEWPEAERAEWTAGALDFARRAHELRMALNPFFDIVHNNIWQPDAKTPSIGGEQYANGVCIEHKFATSNGGPSFHAKYVGRQFAAGVTTRNLIIANSPADAANWAKVPGATHICAQAQYAKVEPSLVGYQDLRLPELQAQVEYFKAKATTQETRAKALEQVVVDITEDRDAAQALVEKYNSKIENAIEILES